MPGTPELSPAQSIVEPLHDLHEDNEYEETA